MNSVESPTSMEQSHYPDAEPAPESQHGAVSMEAVAGAEHETASDEPPFDSEHRVVDHDSENPATEAFTTEAFTDAAVTSEVFPNEGATNEGATNEGATNVGATDERAGSDSASKGLSPLLGSVKSVIADLATHLDRVHEEFDERQHQLDEQRETLRQHEASANQKIAEAHGQAATIVGEAHQQETGIVGAANAEAKQIVDRAHLLDQQLAQRLAEIGRREQWLMEREERFAATSEQQKAEREWLNQYAQNLTNVAADLERAVGDLGGIKADGSER